MSDAMARAAGQAPPDAEIVDEEPVQVAGLRRRLRVTQLRGWTRRTLSVVSDALSTAGARPVGPPVAVLRPLPDGGLEVTAGFPVDHRPPGTSLEHDTLPAGKALQVAHLGSYESLAAAYDRLFERLAGHDGAAGPLLWEQYVVGPQDTDVVDAWYTVVRCPLVAAVPISDNRTPQGR